MANSSDPDIHQKNLQFYDGLWSRAQLLEAHHFNTWPLVTSLLPLKSRRLEIAAGLRPRLPIEGTTFVDISLAALSVLQRHGGHIAQASICKLPFPDNTFDLVCALDIIEHVKDDEAAMQQLSRVITPGGFLLLSTPLHKQFWTPFDDCVGHFRRYEPDQLLTLLTRHGFTIEKSALFGMKPKSNTLTRLGMWFLKHRPAQAMWWYNRILPYTARRQKPLDLHSGLLPLENIGEIFLVCRRTG